MSGREARGYTDPRRNIYIYGMGGVFVLGTLGYYFKPDTRWGLSLNFISSVNAE
jgi:hypothetical protein